MKQRSERVKDKVPHDVRQRYVNMFTEEFLKTSPTVKDSFEKVGIRGLTEMDNPDSLLDRGAYRVTK